MSTTALLERIRKLLALANDERGNEAERDNALRMAHRLLAKHNLDMVEVEEKLQEAQDPRGSWHEVGWSMRWSIQLRALMAKLFMCHYSYGGKVNGTKCRHYYVGRESNVTTAMYMSTYIIDNILKEGRRLYKHNLAPETRSFALGCVRRLNSRVHELIESRSGEAVAAGKNALVLVDLAKREEEANELWLKAAGTTIREARPYDPKVTRGAYSAGYAHGAKISLNQQMARPDEQLSLESK